MVEAQELQLYLESGTISLAIIEAATEAGCQLLAISSRIKVQVWCAARPQIAIATVLLPT